MLENELYRKIITNILWHKLDAIHLKGIWFQQDGAICHIENETTALLRSKFPDPVIS